MAQYLKSIFHMKRFALRVVVVTALVATIHGCANFGYYAQSVSGQMEILGNQKPIEELLDDSNTDPALRQKLRAVLRMREFASQELGLPNNDSYRYYADVKRPYVLWNVFATPEFSTKLKSWCFPIAGCVNYRGYFSKPAADHFATQLQGQNQDVFVGGVAAYSTLGWFHDPVLNTVLSRDEIDLAGLIFHELAHQVVYVPDDSSFNESFATAVELEGVRRWLEKNGSTAKVDEYAKAKSRHAEFSALVLRYRDRLEALYQEKIEAPTMRARKAQEFQNLQRDYHALKQSWGGYSGFDRWFARDLNNAHLASVTTYTQLVPGFQDLLNAQGGDMRRFYRAVKQLAKQDRPERRAALASNGNVPQS